VSALAATDLGALLLAGATAFILWAHPVRGQSPEIYLRVAPVMVLFVLGYAQAGLYPGVGLGPVEKLRRYWTVTGTAFIGLAALIYGVKLAELYSRVTVVLAMLFAFVLVPIGRWLISLAGRSWSWWPEPVLLVGHEASPSRAQRSVLNRQQDLKSAGFLQVPIESSVAEQTRVVQAAYPAARGGVRVVLADLKDDCSKEALERLRTIFPRIILLRDITALPVEGVQIRNLGGVLGIEYGNNLLRRQSRWVKRTLDVLLSGFALVFSLPIVLGAVMAVRLLSPGPALFWQLREGRGGLSFRVPKIRTMVPDAESRMSELLLSGDYAGEWNTVFKLRNDPRIIPIIGQLLRRFSIDELPQLWSVLKGDMSLVGPRPFPEYHLLALEEPARQLRTEVRPGLTGLWQVMARGEADVQEQQAYDLHYIRNWSLWLDLYILGRTVWAVISGRGAY
jgi:Undecaprenyl-phosphate galactose phosphotransferase WbaP